MLVTEEKIMAYVETGTTEKGVLATDSERAKMTDVRTSAVEVHNTDALLPYGTANADHWDALTTVAQTARNAVAVADQAKADDEACESDARQYVARKRLAAEEVEVEKAKRWCLKTRTDKRERMAADAKKADELTARQKDADAKKADVDVKRADVDAKAVAAKARGFETKADADAKADAKVAPVVHKTDWKGGK